MRWKESGPDVYDERYVKRRRDSAIPKCAKQRAAPASEESETRPLAGDKEAGVRQAQLRAIASDLLYWKGGLKVLRQAQLPKWRGLFKWQIEAKIEALQAAYATLRAEAAKEWVRSAWVSRELGR